MAFWIIKDENMRYILFAVCKKREKWRIISRIHVDNWV